MNRRYIALASIVLMVLGLSLLFVGLRRPVTIVIDGQSFAIQTRALTVRQALNSARIVTTPQDQILPPPNHLLGWNKAIQVIRARPVQVWAPETGLLAPIQAANRIPANLLANFGIKLFPKDQIRWNGEVVAPDQPLLLAPSYLLQFNPAIPFTLEENGNKRTLYTTAATIGSALEEAHIALSSSDRLSVPLESPPRENMEITLTRARPITIRDGDAKISSQSAASTIGEALAEAGVPLQGLDYTKPPDKQPIPENGGVRVIRVTEEIVLEQTPIAFETEYTADPETELDQRSIVEAGEPGIKASRIRIRYENGEEVSREIDAEWVAKNPVNQKAGYGTKVVVRTLDTPSGTIEYWRAVNVYATSYSPCRSGTEKCYYGTSLGLPVQRGVIGVTSAWYRLMAGQQVYVPDYGTGTIADIGGGVPGKYWIDLGFTDEEFEPWYYDTTIYFLTPVPESIPWILP